MSRLRLKYVHAWVDQRHGQARARYYFRRAGYPQMPLPSLPGSAEFIAAYQAALAGEALPRPSIGASRTKPGSIGALIAAYYGSAAFLSLKPATRTTYRGILERFRVAHGDKPAALITRQHIGAMLAQRVETPAAANHWLRLMKALMAYAVDQEWRTDNPASGVKPIKNRSEGFHTWAEEEVAAFEQHHPVGSKARLALALFSTPRSAAATWCAWAGNTCAMESFKSGSKRRAPCSISRSTSISPPSSTQRRTTT